MSDQIIVATFSNSDAACDAATALEALEDGESSISSPKRE
jgi:hypothetical protein